MGSVSLRTNERKRGRSDLQANFQMQLASTSNDVLSGLGDPGLDTRVRLGETFEAFNELGKIGGVLDLNGNLDNGGDRELHHLHVVGGLGSGEGTALEKELIDTDGTVFERLDRAAHRGIAAWEWVVKRLDLRGGVSGIGGGRHGRECLLTHEK